jgi:hypothetical protein
VDHSYSRDDEEGAPASRPARPFRAQLVVTR